MQIGIQVELKVQTNLADKIFNATRDNKDLKQMKQTELKISTLEVVDLKKFKSGEKEKDESSESEEDTSPVKQLNVAVETPAPFFSVFNANKMLMRFCLN